MALSREWFIPAKSTKISDKHSDAVAYVYANGAGKPCASVFFGKQAKPVVRCYYSSEAARERDVRRCFEGRRATAKLRVDTRAQRIAANKLVVGDILSTCWGYEQTNREFYQVVAVSGMHVTVREVAQARVSDFHDQGRCAPQSDLFVGPEMRKLVQWSHSVRVGHQTATKCNTDTVAGVPVGPALRWSSYG